MPNPTSITIFGSLYSRSFRTICLGLCFEFEWWRQHRVYGSIYSWLEISDCSRQHNLVQFWSYLGQAIQLNENALHYGAIRINGKILLDTGKTFDGDTKVEYQTKGGKGTIVSVDTDDNTLLIADSSDQMSAGLLRTKQQLTSLSLVRITWTNPC